MARAKQTGRAEARRRYRQATSQPVDAEGVAPDDAAPGAPEAPSDAGRQADPRSRDGRQAPAKPAREQPPARPGFGSAFRAAYHPANVREDLASLPRLLRHWAFLLPVALIVGGAVIASMFWFYTGGQLVFQLLVYPGSGFGVPQLVAGFFAPRASYLLGFLVSLIQGVVAVIFAFNIAGRVGTPIAGDQIGGLLVQAFLAGPLSGSLFAAAAAWYRRFLALSSPRRAAAARQQPARSAKGGSSRRGSGR